MKSKTADRHRNRDMNDDTYKLRRIVMGFIYEAKKIAKLPRIDVRITDCIQAGVLGTARIRDCIIWIPAATLNMKSSAIRHVVFHEICHAAFGTEHDNNCPLMSPVIRDTNIAEQNFAFKNHANN